MEEELLKMSVNARCVGCKEQTKFVAGFMTVRGENMAAFMIVKTKLVR